MIGFRPIDRKRSRMISASLIKTEKRQQEVRNDKCEPYQDWTARNDRCMPYQDQEEARRGQE